MKFDYILAPEKISALINENLLNDFGVIIELSDAYELETGEKCPGDFAGAAETLNGWINGAWTYENKMQLLHDFDLLPDLSVVEYEMYITNGAGDTEHRGGLHFATAKTDGAGALQAWRDHIRRGAGAAYKIYDDIGPRGLQLVTRPELSHVLNVDVITYNATCIL